VSEPVLLFDLFGVIAKVQSEATLAGLERLAEEPGSRLWPAYWGLRQPYDRGDQTGPEYWRLIAARLGRRYDQRRIEQLVEADVRGWDHFDPEMVAFVRELAAGGRRLAMLSNIPLELAEHVERHWEWLALFELRAFSCRIGHAKPEPGAYAWCLARLDVPAEQVCFIDDRESNVLAGRDVGMRGHHFTSLGALRLVVKP
jgi:putative hydrolase of the HAD superfamily